MESFKKVCARAAMDYDVISEATAVAYEWLTKGLKMNCTSQKRLELIDEMIVDGVRQYIENVRSQARLSTPYQHKKTAAAKNQDSEDEVNSMICRYTFYMRMKVRGKSLGQCTFDDIEAHHNHLDAEEKGINVRKRYYAWILSKRKSGKTVEEVIKESVAEEAYRRFLAGEKITQI